MHVRKRHGRHGGAFRAWSVFRRKLGCGRRSADGFGPRSLSADRATHRPCDIPTENTLAGARPMTIPGEASLGVASPFGHASASWDCSLVAFFAGSRAALLLLLPADIPAKFLLTWLG